MAEPPIYPPGSVRALIESDLVTMPTRDALRRRLAGEGSGGPHCFDPGAFATLTAVCARLLPTTGRDRAAAVAGEIDRRLADEPGDGWRFAVMPPDPDMHRQGLAGLDESALAMFRRSFVALVASDQDAVLTALQAGTAPSAVWKNMSAALYFQELLALAVDIHYAHPFALEEIGYVGFADAHGWQAIGLGEREAHEPLPLPRTSAA